MPLTTKAMLKSPLTGRLAIYDLTSHLTLVEGNSTFDPIAFRDTLNNEFVVRGLNVSCSEVKHYIHPVADWIEIFTWVPEETTASLDAQGNIVSAVDPATIIALILAVSALLLATGIIIKQIGSTLRDLSYPSIYWSMPDPQSGILFKGTREEVFSWNSAMYPNLWFDPTTTVALDPNASDFDEKREFILMNTPSGWGEPQPIDWLGGILGIVLPLIIVGGIVLGAIYIIPPILKRAGKKREGKNAES